MTSSASDPKRFISAQELHELSTDLALKVAAAGYKPTFLIALWRGGAYPGAVVQEVLQYVQKTKIDHVAVRTESRDAVTGLPFPEIRVHALGHALSVLRADSRLLIVDDVSDSGRSTTAVVAELAAKLGDRMPRDIKLAVVFAKPGKLRFGPVPDFVVENTDEWLVFPHELEGLEDEEVKKERGKVWRYMQKA